MYSADGLTGINQQKNKELMFFALIALALFSVVITAAVFTPYWVTHILSALMFGALFFIWDTRLRWIYAYRHFLAGIDQGLCQPCSGKVVSFERKIYYRDKVAVYLLEIAQEQDVVRRTYFDIQKQPPTLNAGDEISCQTYNNFIVEYQLED